MKNIDLLRQNIDILEESKPEVISLWLSSEDVTNILQNHEVDVNLFSHDYATPVLNYFIGVVIGENELGDCPVITALLEYLKDKAVSSSELFVICINFRKAVISIFFKHNKMNISMYEDVSYIFDANFQGVLEQFNETILKVKKEAKALYNISRIDHLTNIFNRKKFDEILVNEIVISQKEKRSFSIILLDIDFFKKINDTYGHKMGDKVLVSLTGLVKNHIRDSDIFARWGGEEFVVLMPEVSLDNSKNKANVIKESVASFQFEKIEQVTCSFGVTTYKAGDSATTLFERVDKALYESKTNGRNCITSK